MPSFAVARLGRLIAARAAVFPLAAANACLPRAMRSTLIGAVLSLAAAAAAAATPMAEQVCQARVIAEYKPLLSHEQWLEVVDFGETSGQITAEHAAELRELIAEVYATADIGAWVKRHCFSRAALRDDGESVRTAQNAASSSPAAPGLPTSSFGPPTR